MTDMQKMFVKEYLIDLNATQAAIRAGYSPKHANKQAQNLMLREDIQKAIQKEMQKREQRTEITADKVLQQWWDIATANPNDIICLRRVCCRHCYGKDFEFQWRDKKEYEQAIKAADATAKANETPPIYPSNAGGYGFNRLLRPNPDCPYCAGEGQPELHIKDTRDLDPKARLLFAGVKQTRDGFEVKMRDQDKAMENVAKHLGMFTEKHELNANVTFDIVPAPKPDGEGTD
ncbi:MAG: terminase small subunit [Fastidiosipilaceae bacterium]|jgi:phage terminase small subunit